MTYKAPTADIAFTLRHVAGLDALASDGLYPEATPDVVDAVLEEAGRFATDRIAPLNRDGDRVGSRLVDGAVVTPPGWQETYRDWAAGGWNALAGPPEFGGQGLPIALGAACLEVWNSASMAFGLGPLLTMGSVEALTRHGSPALKERYLAKLVSGEWMGTMNLTEPQAGSDVGALTSRAEPKGDGSYRIFGQKIFITYGEHDLTDNIVHLVLARLAGAPEGTRGISLFLVPKILPDGRRNDVVCAGLEHKLGIHGSPTCTMVYGEAGGATGWLIGEENRGLACMFTMMNNARLAVGLQGVAIAERATQQAFAYAAERRQGRAPGAAAPGMSPIIEHSDVRRMLLEMRAKTGAARGLCYQLAEALDRAHRGGSEAERAAALARASLLTPVAKAFASDIGNEVASIGVQVHGGMGYIEETGAAQHMRDARIAGIYEGTNGIQAIDLVTRKLPLEGGAVVGAEIERLRAAVAGAMAVPSLAGAADRLTRSIDDLARATAWLMPASPEDRLAAATPYLRLFALAAGGVSHMREALAATADEAAPGNRLRIDTALFFAGQIASASGGLAEAVMQGVEALGAPLSQEA